VYLISQAELDTSKIYHLVTTQQHSIIAQALNLPLSFRAHANGAPIKRIHISKKYTAHRFLVTKSSLKSYILITLQRPTPKSLEPGTYPSFHAHQQHLIVVILQTSMLFLRNISYNHLEAKQPAGSQRELQIRPAEFTRGRN
jgi:hypothetical protein